MENNSSDNLEIPEFGHITDTKELAAFLLKQLNSMWVFFIAFVVIAVYWMKHLEPIKED